MGLIIAYIVLIVTGIFCVCLTIREHKKCIQKNYDTEIYNSNLKITKQQLEQEISKLESKREEEANLTKLIYEQNDNLAKDQICLKNIITQLNEQKQNLITEIKVQEQQRAGLEAQMTIINRSIEELTSSQKEAIRAAFESYCDTLDFQYTIKEREFDEDIANLDKLYDRHQESFLQQMSRNEQELNRKREECERDLDIIRSELAKIKSSRAAAIEAQLREQEIKDQATFYMLQLNEADRRDVAYLKSIEFNLREARPLRMLIWTTFYRDKLNDLAARVGAIGACGIYKLTHIESGISYIGQAKDIKTRWSDHVKCALGIDTPVTSQLYAFMREKGVDTFTFEILEQCPAGELNEKEKFYIDLYQTYEYGLNGNKGISK